MGMDRNLLVVVFAFWLFVALVLGSTIPFVLG